MLKKFREIDLSTPFHDLEFKITKNREIVVRVFATRIVKIFPATYFFAIKNSVKLSVLFHEFF